MSAQPFSEAMALCNTCRAVLYSFGMAPDQGRLGQTALQLETRAAQGCRLCALFLGTSIGGALPDMRTLEHNFIRKHEHRGEIIVTYSKQNQHSSYHSLNAVISVESDGPDAEDVVISTLAVLKSASPYRIRPI